ATQLAQISREEAAALRGVPKHPDYFSNFAFIVAGLDRSREGLLKPRSFRMHSATGFQLELSQGGFMMDGKPMIPTYIFAKKYKPEMSVDEMSTLVAQALYDTTMIDASVGGELRVGVMDSDGWRQFPSKDVREKIK